MSPSRRAFLQASVLAAGGISIAPRAGEVAPEPIDVHQQLIDLADRHQARRRARFAAVRTKDDLHRLQDDLRAAFLRLIGGLPERPGAPVVRSLGTIDGGDYLVEKLTFESLPGYEVPALLYRPKNEAPPRPAVLSPCGHSTVGKAAGIYQIFHINLAKRGYVVLTYDPVGQGERSQFWDAERGRSRFNLTCGEHAVLGNPLYLLGGSLARYRIWDGMSGLDVLTSRPDVDPKRIGCAGNSGGGTLTAYLTALDSRIAAAAICCYITALPRRMRNRIQADPDADPEQDIFGFVSEGIDHAGLLALAAPRPTLLGTARFDFFPIEGARESFAEAKHLFDVAGAGDRIERVEAEERHGLSKPIRLAAYSWFDRWLTGRDGREKVEEVPVVPRPASELIVSPGGQISLRSHYQSLLPRALEEADRRKRTAQASLGEVLRLDPELASPVVEQLGGKAGTTGTVIVCINGNETRDWREEGDFWRNLDQGGNAIFVADPRGAGRGRSRFIVKGSDYADPLNGVEENIAYNAFLVGKSLVGMRVTDVIVAVQRLCAERKPERLVVCGRRDGALVACVAAAVEPLISQVAVEDPLLSFRSLFSAEGTPINAASIPPGLLQRFGDVPQVLAQIAPRKVLIAAGRGGPAPASASVQAVAGRFTEQPRILSDWLAR